MLNKLLHAAAVLALITGTSAVAQVGGMVGGTVGGEVSGQIDRSFNRGVSVDGGRGGGGAGGRTGSHPSASSWAPTRAAAMAEESAKTSGGTAKPGGHEEASSSQTEMKKEEPKAGAAKKIGTPAGSTAGSMGASSFGMASKHDIAQFGFSGKIALAGGHGPDHARAEEAKFGKEVAGHPVRAGRHKQRRGKEFMPKLRSPVSTGAQNCENASSLELCTWF